MRIRPQAHVPPVKHILEQVDVGRDGERGGWVICALVGESRRILENLSDWDGRGTEKERCILATTRLRRQAPTPSPQAPIHLKNRPKGQTILQQIPIKTQDSNYNRFPHSETAKLPHHTNHPQRNRKTDSPVECHQRQDHQDSGRGFAEQK